MLLVCKSKLKQYHTPAIMAKIKNTDKTTFYQGYGATGAHKLRGEGFSVGITALGNLGST